MLSIIICCCPAVQCQALLQASFLFSRVSFFALLIHWYAAYAPGQFSFMGKHRTNRWSQEWSNQFINLLNKVLYWYSPSYQGSLGYYLFHRMETLLSPSPTLPRLWPYVSLRCGDLEGTHPLEAFSLSVRARARLPHCVVICTSHYTHRALCIHRALSIYLHEGYWPPLAVAPARCLASEQPCCSDYQHMGLQAKGCKCLDLSIREGWK